eukprot:scaffold73137_cov15-Tisochrysis_lutea.AAC.1
MTTTYSGEGATIEQYAFKGLYSCPKYVNYLNKSTARQITPMLKPMSATAKLEWKEASSSQGRVASSSQQTREYMYVQHGLFNLPAAGG